MINKIKQLLQNLKKPDIENLLVVSMRTDIYLLERWCYLDMINSNVDATRETLLEFIGVEDELLRRGYGDENGQIVPRRINLFYELLKPTNLLQKVQ